MFTVTTVLSIQSLIFHEIKELQFLLSAKPLGFLIGATRSRFLFLTVPLSYWEHPGTLTSFITAPPQAMIALLRCVLHR